MLWSSLVFGQSTSTLPCTQNCTVARSQPFTVTYNWAPTTENPDLPDGFRMYQNGVVIGEASVLALANGTISFAFPNGLSSGNYTLAMSAYITGGGETMGDPITVTVLRGKPVKPTNGRVQ
jgi:hypothetical protein